jgi:hypothetical protein
VKFQKRIVIMSGIAIAAVCFRGGPYRLVLPSKPVIPWRDSWQHRFAYFLSDRHLIPDAAYKARWRLEGNPALLSASFRVSEGRPLRKEDLPVVYLSSPN